MCYKQLVNRGGEDSEVRGSGGADGGGAEDSEDVILCPKCGERRILLHMPSGIAPVVGKRSWARADTSGRTWGSGSDSTTWNCGGRRICWRKRTANKFSSGGTWYRELEERTWTVPRPGGRGAGNWRRGPDECGPWP